MSQTSQPSQAPKPATIPKPIRFLFGGGAGYAYFIDQQDNILIDLDLQNVGHLLRATTRSNQESDAT